MWNELLADVGCSVFLSMLRLGTFVFWHMLLERTQELAEILNCLSPVGLSNNVTLGYPLPFPNSKLAKILFLPLKR